MLFRSRFLSFLTVPAKRIGERFDEETVKKLLNLRWWDKGEEWITEHSKEFCNPGLFLSNEE